MDDYKQSKYRRKNGRSRHKHRIEERTAIGTTDVDKKADNLGTSTNTPDANGEVNNLGTDIGLINADRKVDNLGPGTGIRDVDGGAEKTCIGIGISTSTSISNSDSNSNIRSFKFISFSNNRSSYFKQLTTKRFLIMLHKFVNKNLSDYSKNNSSSSIRHSKFFSFFVNNRSGHFE